MKEKKIHFHFHIENINKCKRNIFILIRFVFDVCVIDMWLGSRFDCICYMLWGAEGSYFMLRFSRETPKLVHTRYRGFLLARKVKNVTETHSYLENILFLSISLSLSLFLCFSLAYALLLFSFTKIHWIFIVPSRKLYNTFSYISLFKENLKLFNTFCPLFPFYKIYLSHFIKILHKRKPSENGFNIQVTKRCENKSTNLTPRFKLSFEWSLKFN